MHKKRSMSAIVILLIIGLVAGYMSGLIGVGGGIIIVPALVYFLGADQKTAQGSTLFLFLLPVGLLGVINYYKAGHMDYKTALVIAITFVVGSYLGSKTAIAIDTRIVKQIFGATIVAIGIKMIFFDK
jgi:uncharacterized membrane protein YfcA